MAPGIINLSRESFGHVAALPAPPAGSLPRPRQRAPGHPTRRPGAIISLITAPLDRGEKLEIEEQHASRSPINRRQDNVIFALNIIVSLRILGIYATAGVDRFGRRLCTGSHEAVCCVSLEDV